jgi:hypothetical protein
VDNAVVLLVGVGEEIAGSLAYNPPVLIEVVGGIAILEVSP